MVANNNANEIRNTILKSVPHILTPMIAETRGLTRETEIASIQAQLMRTAKVRSQLKLCKCGIYRPRLGFRA